MKTKEQVERYAKGVAWGMFYADEDVLWEPFENYPQQWVDEQCAILATAIETAMLWAQGETQ
jgi:hypothetical protein